MKAKIMDNVSAKLTALRNSDKGQVVVDSLATAMRVQQLAKIMHPRMKVVFKAATNGVVLTWENFVKPVEEPKAI